MLLSIILVPISLLNIEGIISIILGIPFITFIPGYVLIFALFPKIDQGIGIIERFGLSFGLSIALVPIICLILNYTSWGIRLESVLFSIFIFINSIGFIAFYRWTRVSPDQRYTISPNLSFLKSQNKLDYSLNIIIVLSILIAIILPIYILSTQKTGEKFTEFYFASFEKNSNEVKKNFTIAMGISTTSENITVVNHEYETIDYTIEIWLINQSDIKNESDNTTQNIINNMWFLNKTTTGPLKHLNVEIGKNQTKSPIYSLTFLINRSGIYKLTYLLFKTPTADYIKDYDIKDKAEQKISEAYREIHQWIDVKYYTPPKADFRYSPEQPYVDNTIYFTSNYSSTDSRIVNWEWDFGDGNTSYGKSIGLDFDGINDYVDCGNNTNLQPVNGTVEALIYPKELLRTQLIFSGSGGYIHRHPNFRLDKNWVRIVLSNNTDFEWHTYITNLHTNTWYHLAATWDSLNVKFYENGLLKDTQTQNFTPAGNTNNKYIGSPYSPETFNGTIKDIKIYNRSLNDIEILNNYYGDVTTNGLISWWTMDNTGNITYDVMEHNNGTIYGANWVNQAEHRYRNTGEYWVKLTITDEYGQINSIYKKVVVT